MEKKIDRHLVADNADYFEEKDYVMPLTAEESSIAKDRVVEVSIQIAKIEEEKKSEMEKYKDLLKPLRAENAILLKDLQYKVKEHTGTVYILSDHNEGMVGEYTKDGDLIHSRPMLPKEKQLTLKTGTHN